MENYEVVSLVGEGSCGRVYKAKVLNTDEFVAFKVIVKKGRSNAELKELRQECEIQRTLHHPNIIQMLDSFETDNEIVVVTEFVEMDLYQFLSKEGYLPEDTVKNITSDLISALFYLHSHRVIHRDLKPQNVLLDERGVAKLCDFGFARSMGTGTHVLTSVKGTPLYMAPEVINAKPYDHNTDLWSLGCIIYELLVGYPPFRTSSLLELIRLIQGENIRWPKFFSRDSKNFLQGLLDKDPEKRWTWSQILDHPFLKNCSLRVETEGGKHPFTSDLSASQTRAKEIQKREILESSGGSGRYPCGQYGHNPFLAPRPLRHVPAPKTTRPDPPSILCGTNSANPVKTSSCPSQSAKVSDSLTNITDKKMTHSSLRSIKSLDLANEKKLYTSLASELETLDISRKGSTGEGETEGAAAAATTPSQTEQVLAPTGNTSTGAARKTDKAGTFKKSRAVFTLHSWDSAASARPIENDEWLAFLQRNMEEIIAGQLDCLRNHNLVSVVVAPLRNSNASCRVLEYVACMLSLPFVVDGPSEKDLDNIKQVYLEMKLIPNLVYASKIVARNKGYDSESSSPSVPSGSEMLLRPVSELSADELLTLECIYLLICHLVHRGDDFLIQFCDAAVILNTVSLLQQFLLLGRRKVRIVTDLLAILNLILRELPENADVVEQIVLCGGPVDLSRLFTHSSRIIRSRTCELVKQLSVCRPGAVRAVWTSRLYQDLNALLSDSVSSVRLSAEEALHEIKACIPNKNS